jgi:hypothetical protein
MRKAKPNSERKMAPIDLEILESNDGFALMLDSEVLLTESGVPIQHAAAPLLEHMISEFDGQGATITVQSRRIVAPKFFGCYALFGIQKEWIESWKDDLSLGFEERLVRDPILHPVAGAEQVDQYARWVPVDDWLGRDRVNDLRCHAFLVAHEFGLDDFKLPADPPLRERVTPFIAELSECYRALPPEQRCVVMYLNAIHHGPVLFPLALVLGKCNVNEYAQGIMASQAVLSGIFVDVNDKDHLEVFERLREDARTALEYVSFYRKGTPRQRAGEIIAAGEGARLEFKSTLRMNLHTNKNDDAITHACLKTVAAFLNTDGGQLLIGVADDGSIIGIERDGFQNPDKFELHLWNTLKQAFGEAASTVNVKTEVLAMDGKSICLVECKPSTEPVICKVKGGGEEFYIRTGPATTPLTPSAMLAYIPKHFSKATPK